MKNLLYASVGLFLIACQQPEVESEPTNDIDQKVEDLLSKMSVEEKCGQMTQINMTVVAKQNDATNLPEGERALDPEKLRHAIVECNVGSILNALEGRKHMQGWHEIMNDIQDVATKETPNKIPILVGVDAIHGATYLYGSTLFPHNIGLAASRNPELAYRASQITAMETRATGVRWNFDPVFDVGRTAIWPRFAETYGEDVHIVSEFGVASVLGYEDRGIDTIVGVASCMKHYVGYSKPVTGWDRTPASIPERELREYYLPQFQKAIDAGAKTLMINSADVNGIPTHANKYLLTDVLRYELGFEGLAVSDWEDIIMLHTKHKVADSPKEAVKMAVNAGVDMSMVPMDLSFYHLLVELVNEGKVPMARIDEAVSRILKLKFELGLFDNAYPEPEALKNFKQASYKDDALKAALETMTLLKNNGNVLPIKKGTKIFVGGPAANNKSSLHGCWSYSWQGNEEEKYPESTHTIVDALKIEFGETNIISQAVSKYDSSINFSLNGARQADVFVLCIGENAYAETPGSIKDLNLDANQKELVKLAKELNKPIVAVLVEGRPRVINDIEPLLDGVLMAYWPAELGADAIAQVLSGKYNPNGRLPFTYPRTTGHQVLYDHRFSERGEEHTQDGYTYTGYNPQWAFGAGLSYSEFKYDNLTISADTLSGSDTLSVSVSVKNIGEVDGGHSIELYSRDHYATITPSFQRLRAFDKIWLKAGESKTVTFSITEDDLKFIGLEDTQWVIEDGAFDITVGDLSKDFYYISE